MARPKKKLNYNKECQMQETLEMVKESYVECQSINQVAKEFSMTPLKVRKILITEGVFHSEVTELIQKLSEEGKNMQDIMRITGLGRASLNSYLPYSKNIYNMTELSVDAKRVKKFRLRKRAVEELKQLIFQRGLLDCNENTWEVLRLFQGYTFHTFKGLAFHYTIRGNEMFVDRKEKSITRSTIEVALKVVADKNGVVTGPKQLGCFGASYLYPIFIRIGLIKNKTIPVCEYDLK